MNEPITFVTSNDYKFRHAMHILSTKGVELTRQHMDLDELQTPNGEILVRHKAQQAFNALRKPVVVNDDTWIIPGLQGFPGPYMKDINGWLTPEDWLRLTRDLDDRRITLRQNTMYMDADGQHYFSKDINGTLLTEIRGVNKFPHLTIMTFNEDTGRSAAEIIADGRPAISANTPTSWHDFADWLANRYNKIH